MLVSASAVQRSPALQLNNIYMAAITNLKIFVYIVCVRFTVHLIFVQIYTQYTGAKRKHIAHSVRIKQPIRSSSNRTQHRYAYVLYMVECKLVVCYACFSLCVVCVSSSSNNNDSSALQSRARLTFDQSRAFSFQWTLARLWCSHRSSPHPAGGSDSSGGVAEIALYAYVNSR